MGNYWEGRSFWWQAPPFHFDYEYDGTPYEYTIWRSSCWEADQNCIDDGKIWFAWKWGVGLLCCVICCCLQICKIVMKN